LISRERVAVEECESATAALEALRDRALRLFTCAVYRLPPLRDVAEERERQTAVAVAERATVYAVRDEELAGRGG
jgi:hypothetical protein